MTLDDFIASLKHEKAPTGLSAPLQALWHAARDDWDEPHGIVQAESSQEAARVHAYLHRVEGDLANTGYWYRRARREVSYETLEAEWRSIVGALLETL